jgi:filamentous hemagglutinin
MVKEGEGGTTTTATLPSFVGPTKPQIIAPGGLVVIVGKDADKTGTMTDKRPLATVAVELSKQPGFEYLADITKREDVDWQQVKLIQDKWEYKQEGLTPAGATLLSLAVAWATAGAGAGLIGSAGTTATGATTLAGATANAAFTSLATQASITLVNNKGNIEKTLKDLSSSQTVRATLTSALTAGALQYVNTNVLPGVLDKLSITDAKSLQGRLVGGAFEGTTSALVDTAINEGSLEENLKNALLMSEVNAAHGFTASKIKTQENNYILHKILHAVAGCAAAAASRSECEAGAIGAATSEIFAPLFDKPQQFNSQEEINAYKNKVNSSLALISGFISAYAGYDATTAINTASIAVSNNYLSKLEQEMLMKELNLCGRNDTTCANKVIDKYLAISKKNDGLLQNSCSATSNSYNYFQCQQHIKNALNYAGDAFYTPLIGGNGSASMPYLNPPNQIKEDITRSRKIVLSAIFSGDAYSSTFKGINDIDARADFFGAMSREFPKSKWFSGANDVSRRCLSGLGADGCGSYLTFGIAGALSGVDAYDWRKEAGEALMLNGYNDFKMMWEGKVTDYKQWDINRLIGEQTTLQPIHQKYLSTSRIGINESVLLVKLPKITTFGGGKVNMLDLNDRIRYGCQLMNYNYVKSGNLGMCK